MEIGRIKATKRGKTLLGVLLGLLLVILFLLVNWYVKAHTYITVGDAKVTGEILNASTRITGKIANINVKDGDSVKRGDLLFVLESDQILAQVNQAEAALGIAKAQLTKAVGKARSEELEGAESLVEQASAIYSGSITNRESLQTTLITIQSAYNSILMQMKNFKNPGTGHLDANYAAKQLNTAYIKSAITDVQYTVQAQALQELFSTKIQLEAQINQIQGQIKTLDSAVIASRAGLKGAESKLKLLNNGASSKDVEILIGNVKAAQAAYDLAKLSLDYARVRAPEAGTIVQLSSHIGDVVTPGLSAVSLIDLSKLMVTAYVFEDELKKVKLGSSVKISIDAFSGKTFKGTVKEIGKATASVLNVFAEENSVDNFTKVKQRVPIKISFDYKGTQVIPGMSALAKIKIK